MAPDLRKTLHNQTSLLDASIPVPNE
jgi:hypothetical protein